MLILMDGSEDSEKILDVLARLFGNQQNHYDAAFVNGMMNHDLEELFETHGEGVKMCYSYSEVLDMILRSRTDNSEVFIRRFIGKCGELKLRTRLYLNAGSVNEGFVNDSLFSDMLVIGKELVRTADKDCGELIEGMMRTARCPLLLLSGKTHEFNTVILLFDGTHKSFETIKLFIYLAGEQCNTSRFILFTVMNEEAIFSEKKVCDYLKLHQPFFSIHRIYPDSYYSDLLTVLREMDNFLLVTGVDRKTIIEDLIFNRDDSFFAKDSHSVFMS